MARLNRAVATGHSHGPHAGLDALDAVDPALPRRTAAEAYLHERAGDRAMAATLYAGAAAEATSLAEQRHLTRKAAELGSCRD